MTAHPFAQVSGADLSQEDTAAHEVVVYGSIPSPVGRLYRIIEAGKLYYVSARNLNKLRNGETAASLELEPTEEEDD